MRRAYSSCVVTTVATAGKLTTATDRMANPGGRTCIVDDLMDGSTVHQLHVALSVHSDCEGHSLAGLPHLAGGCSQRWILGPAKLLNVGLNILIRSSSHIGGWSCLIGVKNQPIAELDFRGSRLDQIACDASVIEPVAVP